MNKKSTLGFLCGLFLNKLYWFIPDLSSFGVGFNTGIKKHLFFHLGNASMICRNSRFINPQNISIGNYSCISSFCYIEASSKDSYGPRLMIGDYCSIGEYTHISAYNSICIGNGVLTGRFVLITDNSHGTTDKDSVLIMPNNRPIISKGAIKIGNNVWIGDKVTILPNVTIGDGAIIGANTVVTKNIPSFSVVVGPSSRVL